MRYIFIIFLFFLSKAEAASFDCSKAKSSVEKAICSDIELSNLDESLAKVYKVALKDHPVQNFVRAKQRDWLDLNNYCDKDKFKKCLKANYLNRIAQLTSVSQSKIYSNTLKFDLQNGDAVAEIQEINGKYLINIFGGFRVHRQASIDTNKAVYIGCDFIGYFNLTNGGKAVSQDGGTFEFKLSNNKLIISENSRECPGNGNLPEFLELVEKEKTRNK